MIGVQSFVHINLVAHHTRIDHNETWITRTDWQVSLALNRNGQMNEELSYLLWFHPSLVFPVPLSLLITIPALSLSPPGWVLFPSPWSLPAPAPASSLTFVVHHAIRAYFPFILSSLHLSSLLLNATSDLLSFHSSLVYCPPGLSAPSCWCRYFCVLLRKYNCLKGDFWVQSADVVGIAVVTICSISVTVAWNGQRQRQH